MCDCMPNYYDTATNTSTCLQCYYTCLTCNQPTQCITCPSTRSLSLTACLCLPGYYDDGSSLNCLQCHYSCQTCQTAASCFSCDVTKYRLYNETTQLCSCKIGYYDAGV